YLLGGRPDVAGTYAGSLDAKPAEQSRERILATATAAPYVDGNLFFLRDGTLMVQPFDAGKLQLRGEAVPLGEHVQVILSIGAFSVSPAGVLAYRSGQNTVVGYQLTWLDRQGRPTGTVGQPNLDAGIRISPDGARASLRDGQPLVNGDLWL